MQFVVWRNSPKARVLVEFVVTLTFATVIHLMVASIMDNEPYLREHITAYLTMKESLSHMNAST